MGLCPLFLHSSDTETKVKRDYVICPRLHGQDAAVLGLETRAVLTTLLACLLMEKVNGQIRGADAQCLSPGGSAFPECLAPSSQGVWEHEPDMAPIRRDTWQGSEYISRPPGEWYSMESMWFPALGMSTKVRIRTLVQVPCPLSKFLSKFILKLSTNI